MTDEIYSRVLGTTSAYAEKSDAELIMDGPARNYLRIRGEEGNYLPKPMIAAELPPHTRRRVVSDCEHFHQLGTTSAYAEKSEVAWS